MTNNKLCRGIPMCAPFKHFKHALQRLGRHAALLLVPKLGYIAAYARQAVENKLIEHKEYIARYGIDMHEITSYVCLKAGRTGEV